MDRMANRPSRREFVESGYEVVVDPDDGAPGVSVTVCNPGPPRNVAACVRVNQSSGFPSRNDTIEAEAIGVAIARACYWEVGEWRRWADRNLRRLGLAPDDGAMDDKEARSAISTILGRIG